MTEKRLSPDLLAIISSKVNNISKQMTYTLQRSARSSIMSSARDFSTAICDGSGDVIALPNGFPVHVANMSLTAKSVFDFHGDRLKPGDAYLNNSPYHGNTHMADHTIIVPVFYEDELMFLCTVRGHQADIGNSVPTTYHAPAKDIYEEGALCFPCVKIQDEYQDVEDIVRMAKMRIRVPDVWYGDYLGMIGAARIGERELAKLIDKYGKETIKAFCREWHEYGEKRMIEEIKKLPAGTWTNYSTHDPLPGIVPDGIRVNVTVTIDPEEGQVIVDYTDNDDPVACGLNLCEATVLSSGRTGVLNYLGADVPLCEGALKRIVVKMRETGVVGKASLPYSSSVATTNVADRAILAVQTIFNGLKEGLGMAEGSLNQPPSMSVISGYDSRYDRPYVTQLFTGVTGGMGVHGHDGYLMYAIANAGLMEWNSIEMLEQKYPIRYLEQEIIQDSGGAGKWDGAPATRVVMTPTEDEVTFIYVCDGKDNPPRGALKGHSGSPANAALFKLEEGPAAEKELPTFNQLDLKPGEALVSEISSGAGYGDPLERDPEMVRHRVREGWISAKKARDIYGVVIRTDSEHYSVDYPSTEALREKLKESGVVQ
ncbi:hydantoinase B/oxoprolinase family protein [Siminovitchia sediminis]|uniref:Hydantoinase B/oxoprolinase family protein n=1 Tax=Siminovitchia sediminis TaxID=1274353 RepID=A0ABW4KKL1_9BACI